MNSDDPTLPAPKPTPFSRSDDLSDSAIQRLLAAGTTTTQDPTTQDPTTQDPTTQDPTALSLLAQTVAPDYDSAQMQEVLNRLDELLLALKRN